MGQKKFKQARKLRRFLEEQVPHLNCGCSPEDLKSAHWQTLENEPSAKRYFSNEKQDSNKSKEPKFQLITIPFEGKF